MTLKDIIEIKEGISGVSGITREKIMPHDVLQIEDKYYQISMMETIHDGTIKFEAVPSRYGKSTKFKVLIKINK
jgi:hypothetical protein